jgi:hypothetical protein
VTYNPRFRGKRAAQDAALDDIFDDCATVKMVSRDATPLAFVVPEGYDAVEFSYGAISINRCTGSDADLDLAVALGAPQVRSGDGEAEAYDLSPGTALLVTVPWRAASSVSLPANHLMAPVYARFYSRIQPFAIDDNL